MPRKKHNHLAINRCRPISKREKNNVLAVISLKNLQTSIIAAHLCTPLMNAYLFVKNVARLLFYLMTEGLILINLRTCLEILISRYILIYSSLLTKSNKKRKNSYTTKSTQKIFILRNFMCFPLFITRLKRIKQQYKSKRQK